MTNLLKPIMLATATVAMLGACSTASAADEKAEEWRSDARLGEKVDRVCFASNIDNFREPTRNTVIVEEGVNDEYLIEVMGSCYDLDRANSLSFDTFPGASCITKGDAIYAYDSVFGPNRADIPPVRCPIKAIYKWDEDADEQKATD